MLLDVTEQGHSAEDPVVRVGCLARGGWCTKTHCCDIGEVCTTRLLVHRTEVELVVSQMVRRVDSIQVDHRERCEEDFGWRLHQTTSLPVPARSIQVETMHIHSFWWRL